MSVYEITINQESRSLIRSWLAGRTAIRCLAAAVASLCFLQLAACGVQTGNSESGGSASAEPLLPVLTRADWGDYIDPVSGFKARVPAGWTAVVLGEAQPGNWYESEGHAITFQSPASSDSDTYSDYIMVEFLPSAPSAGFITDSADKHAVTIDGRTTVRERVVMYDFPVENTSIDLVAYQLLSAELGYSMGLYVVGELREDSRLVEIFSTFRQNFVFPPDNLQVTQR